MQSLSLTLFKRFLTTTTSGREDSLEILTTPSLAVYWHRISFELASVASGKISRSEIAKATMKWDARHLCTCDIDSGTTLQETHPLQKRRIEDTLRPGKPITPVNAYLRWADLL